MDCSRLLPAAPSIDGVTRLAVDRGSSDCRLGALAAGEPAWAVGDGVVTVSVHLLGVIADLVSAAQEQASTAQDRHGRVPAAENQLVQAGLAGRPVVQTSRRDHA